MALAPEPALVRRAVEIDHDLFDLDLLLDGLVAQRLEDFAVDGLDRLLHALAEIALLVAVPSSTASCAPVEAPEGTAARPIEPSSSTTSTSTVGLPRLSRISRPMMSTMAVMSALSWEWWVRFRGRLTRRASKCERLGSGLFRTRSRVRIDCSKVDISVQAFTFTSRGNAINRRQFLWNRSRRDPAAPASCAMPTPRKAVSASNIIRSPQVWAHANQGRTARSGSAAGASARWDGSIPQRFLQAGRPRQRCRARWHDHQLPTARPSVTSRWTELHLARRPAITG